MLKRIMRQGSYCEYLTVGLSSPSTGKGNVSFREKSNI
jgi:hypothetical protein